MNPGIVIFLISFLGVDLDNYAENYVYFQLGKRSSW